MSLIVNPSVSFKFNSSSKEVDIYAKQGADWVFKLKLKDANGDPLNLTGYTVRGHIRKTYDSPTYYAWACEITNAQQGEVTVSMPNSITSTIPAGLSATSAESIYVYDFEVVDTSGRVSRAFQGKLYIDPEVTK